MTISIIPKQDFRQMGSTLHLVAGVAYTAIPATNQPDWEARGKVFVQTDDGTMLLENGDYTKQTNRSK